jgi:acyl-CoA synthetase (AMP-forming)/AMP-acid ligase II
MLIRGSENIYCVEIEEVLLTHPAVIDAAVIGLPRRILGEEAGAVVQIKPGQSVSAHRCADRRAAPKRRRQDAEAAVAGGDDGEAGACLISNAA